ncbi:hypothetical protein QLX67_13800 [Balneolaceae bacterium ANBcel3]|nr:hypothetical protein [Balneolaceae bacterium ANBcel3]
MGKDSGNDYPSKGDESEKAEQRGIQGAVNRAGGIALNGFIARFGEIAEERLDGDGARFKEIADQVRNDSRVRNGGRGDSLRCMD